MFVDAQLGNEGNSGQFKRLLHHFPFSTIELESMELLSPSRGEKFTELEINLFQFMLTNHIEKSSFKLGEHGLGKTSWTRFEKRWRQNLKTLKAWSVHGQSPFPEDSFFIRSATQLKEKFKYMQKTSREKL